MAKPTKYAAIICVILTIIVALGIVFGLLKSNPLVIVLSLLPTVIYEIYRTEGRSTKWASWLLLIVLVTEIVFIIFKINFDLASFFQDQDKYIAGYRIPLGDVKIVAPALLAILSVILFIRTYGIYTKWLAVMIFIGCFVIVYSLDPEIFKILLRFGVEEGLEILY